MADRSGSRRILIVSKDPVMRKLASKGLFASGFRIYEASNAHDARHTLAGVPYDMLITDMDLPDESGVSLAFHARTLFPVIPVLFITNRREDEQVTRRLIARSSLERPYGVMALAQARAAAVGAYED